MKGASTSIGSRSVAFTSEYLQCLVDADLAVLGRLGRIGDDFLSCSLNL